jgi:hypothetical protein
MRNYFPTIRREVAAQACLQARQWVHIQRDRMTDRTIPEVTALRAGRSRGVEIGRGAIEDDAVAIVGDRQGKAINGWDLSAGDQLADTLRVDADDAPVVCLSVDQNKLKGRKARPGCLRTDKFAAGSHQDNETSVWRHGVQDQG